MYITTKSLSIIRQVELIKKEEFASIVFDLEDKTFIIYVAFLVSLNLDIEIHFFGHAQIVLLKANKVFIVVPSKYIDLINIFSPNFVAKLPEYIKINNYSFNFVNN